MLWHLGYDVIKFRLEASLALKKRRLSEHHRIDAVFDVGANDGESLFPGMLAYLQRLGYQLVGLDPGFTDAASGHLLQTDALFARVPN